MNISDLSDVNSEAGVVASAILNPELTFYSEQLTPHHFANEQNGYLYYAICELARRDINQIDAYNITNILNSNPATREKADTLLPIAAINDFIATAPAIARGTVEEYKLVVDSVLNAAFRRDTYQRLSECQRICFDRSETDIEHKIYETLDDVMMEFSSANDMPLYKDVIGSMWQDIKARQTGQTPTIEFPFPLLNEYVVMEPGELICFTGAAKSGKSAMLLTCTVDLLRKGKSVLYIDSELSTRLFSMRILSHLTGITFANLRSGNYTPEDERRIEDSVAWLKTRNFIHLYLPSFDENTMYLAAKKAKHMINIDCIVVDYLKSTSSKDEAFSVYAEMGRISDTLKNKVCGDLSLIGLTAAQATSTGRIADSARIARSVSTVVSIQDKTIDEMQEQGPNCGNKKLRVVFNRNGNQMQEDEWIDLQFDGSVITYKQAPEQHELLEPF